MGKEHQIQLLKEHFSAGAIVKSSWLLPEDARLIAPDSWTSHFTELNQNFPYAIFFPLIQNQ